MTPEEHLRHVRIVGTRQVGRQAVLTLMCSGPDCGAATMFSKMTAGDVHAGAIEHVQQMAELATDTPACAPCAADLPVGSVVANEYTAWIKREIAANGGPGGVWQETGNEMDAFDFEPQESIDNEGARVLRVGAGSLVTS